MSAGKTASGKTQGLGFFFFLQLALNFLWSPLFFGLQNPLLGLIDILAPLTSQ